jgi:hypothetical protein
MVRNFMEKSKIFSRFFTCKILRFSKKKSWQDHERKFTKKMDVRFFQDFKPRKDKILMTQELTR